MRTASFPPPPLFEVNPSKTASTSTDCIEAAASFDEVGEAACEGAAAVGLGAAADDPGIPTFPVAADAAAGLIMASAAWMILPMIFSNILIGASSLTIEVD